MGGIKGHCRVDLADKMESSQQHKFVEGEFRLNYFGATLELLCMASNRFEIQTLNPPANH